MEHEDAQGSFPSKGRAPGRLSGRFVVPGPVFPVAPVGAPILRQTEREVPERLRPGAGPDLERGGEKFGRLEPECHLVSNGSYHVFCQDNGLTSSKLGENQILLAQAGRYYAPSGVSAFFRGAVLLYLTAG